MPLKSPVVECRVSSVRAKGETVNSRQNDERTQKQEKRGSGQLRQAACFAICLVSAEIGVHRLQSIAPEVNGDFFPGQLPCIVCSGVEIGACGSTAFLQAEI